MLSDAVMQTLCGHPYVFIVAKIACGQVDNIVPLADSWCRASFAWHCLLGRESGRRARSLIVLPRGLTRRAGISCLASVLLIEWLSWSETKGTFKVKTGNKGENR